MLIEIVANDYYASPNGHVVMNNDKVEKLPEMHKEYQVAQDRHDFWSFKEWLIAREYAFQPTDMDYMVFDENDGRLS